MKNIIVIAEGPEAIASLVTGAKSFGENVTLIYAGTESDAVGADKAYYLGDLKEDSFLNYVPVIVERCEEISPELVLTSTDKNGRLIAGILAGRFNAGITTDGSVSVENGVVTGVRMVYGGAAHKTESISGMAIACVSAGAFEAVELEPCTDVTALVPQAKVKFVEKRQAVVSKVNLGAAKKVIGVGRGIGSQDALKGIFELAEMVGAEVGCSRPVAEENHWLPKELYIGVSGVMLKPDIYCGLGISGQVQHMVGVNSANTIVAINKDKNAPIFKQCDLGLVADLNVVLPAIKERLS